MTGQADQRRVLRGGSFDNNDRNARCAYRNHNPINNLNINRGFRVVASYASLFFGYQGAALCRAPEVLCVHGCTAEAKQER